jgi:DNA-directed RNA polymerase specialized sigma24 family protein
MKDHATTEEILLTLKGLTKESMTGLIKAASVHMHNTRFSEPMDLVHEAMDLLLRGDRHWPKDMAFGPFMFATMRSIANSQRQRMEFRTHDSYEEMGDFGLDGIDCHPSAEEVAMSRERSALLKILMLDAKRTLDANDANAHIVLGAMMEDRTPAQICEATGMSISEYKEARQRTLRHARRQAKQKPL